MRKLFLMVWLTLPVGALAYHMGPGQDWMRVDAAADCIERGDAHAREAQRLSDEAAASAWAKAEEAYEEALKLLPVERVAERRALRLERAKAQMFISELPEANSELTTLVVELEADSEADVETLNEARRALANSQYYVTWLMRLEGRPRTDWEPEIELARQLYKLLAAEPQSEGQARKNQEDLESAVRLARMDLEELQGLPLPSQ